MQPTRTSETAVNERPLFWRRRPDNEVANAIPRRTEHLMPVRSGALRPSAPFQTRPETPEPVQESYEFGPFRLVRERRLLTRHDLPVAIGDRALDILLMLLDRAPAIISRDEFDQAIWSGVVVEDANLRFQISALRKVLGDGRYIATITRRGYAFVAPVRRSPPVMRPVTPNAARRAEGAHLPAACERLVGRDRDVADICALLRDHQLVTLAGPAGIGKSAVAIAAAHALGRDNIRYISLTDIGDPALVPAIVAAALDPVDATPRFDDSVTCASDDPQLLLLDACELVAEALVPVCEQLMVDRPQLRLLVTSREALRLRGEYIYLLDRLACPEHDDVTADQALAAPAVQFFLHKAASSGYRAAPSERELGLVARLCRKLDGCAFAIEILASRVGTFGLNGVANLLETGAALLLDGARGGQSRHRTLKAMLDSSFERLSESEQKLICKLAGHEAPFCFAEARTLLGPGLEKMVELLVAQLVEKSMLEVVPCADGAPRFRLPWILRAYAAINAAA